VNETSHSGTGDLTVFMLLLANLYITEISTADLR